MGKLLLILLVLLAGFMALAIWLYNTFGVWGFLGALAVFVVFVYALKFFLVWGFKRLFMAPFKAKGAVLTGAQLVIHSVTTAEPPSRSSRDDLEDEENFEDDEEDTDDANGDAHSLARQDDEADEGDDDFEGDEEGPQDWYFVDATITPRPPQGAFRLWEPGELVLVNPQDTGEDIAAEDLGHVADIEVWQDGRWQPDEGYKYEGQQRLRMRVGLQPGTKTARFKYYFEVFGDTVEFPAPIDV
jgi:hypothetical protein